MYIKTPKEYPILNSIKMAMLPNRENFRAVDGYPDYEISDHGRVRRVKTGRILRGHIRRGGYRSVILSQEGKLSTINIHRLVATAFCDKPAGCTIVDHIDQDRQNNLSGNLRWTTVRGNGMNRKMSKNNTSGTNGVTYYGKKNQWRVMWRDDQGRQKTKSFSANKYDNAEELAIQYRKQIEQELGYP